MGRLSRRFDEYAEAHRSPGNRLCHLLGWPLIGVGLVGLLARVPVGPLDLGWVLAALLWVSWLMAEPKLGLLILPAAVALHPVGARLPAAADAGLLLLGNVVPILGHVLVEKNAPATLKEGLVGTWLGPLFSLKALLSW